MATVEPAIGGVLLRGQRAVRVAGADGLRADLGICRAAALAGTEGRGTTTVEDVRRDAPPRLGPPPSPAAFDDAGMAPDEIDQALELPPTRERRTGWRPSGRHRGPGDR